MQLIDTHAHLYLPEFEKDWKEIISRSKKNGVAKVVLPNIDKGSAAALLKLVEEDPDYFIPMMGLHPCYVKEDFKEELKELETIFFRQEISIVGEIGLDYYWSKDFIKEQKEAFREQIAWAKQKNGPIAIHCRNAYNDVIRILSEEQDGNLKGVLHCFSGTLEEANKLIDLGFKLGIGGVVTFKNAGLDKIVEEIDLEHIVLETDAPYLAPVPFRGKRNETSYINLVAEKLAVIKGVELAEIARSTTKNAQELFKIAL